MNRRSYEYIVVWIIFLCVICNVQNCYLRDLVELTKQANIQKTIPVPTPEPTKAPLPKPAPQGDWLDSGNGVIVQMQGPDYYLLTVAGKEMKSEKEGERKFEIICRLKLYKSQNGRWVIGKHE
jgi:hypothetical protein